MLQTVYTTPAMMTGLTQRRVATGALPKAQLWSAETNHQPVPTFSGRAPWFLGVLLVAIGLLHNVLQKDNKLVKPQVSVERYMKKNNRTSALITQVENALSKFYKAKKNLGQEGRLRSILNQRNAEGWQPLFKITQINSRVDTGELEVVIEENDGMLSKFSYPKDVINGFTAFLNDEENWEKPEGNKSFATGTRK